MNFLVNPVHLGEAFFEQLHWVLCMESLFPVFLYFSTSRKMPHASLRRNTEVYVEQRLQLVKMQGK